MNTNKWIPVVAILGLACLALGIYSVTRTPTDINQPVSSSTPVPPQISILLNYVHDKTHWDEYEPGYNTETRPPVHIWMRRVGQITYHVELAPNAKHLVVRLSSELNKQTSTDPNLSSDVTLLIDGKEIGTKNVVTDNEIGQDYSWDIPKSDSRFIDVTLEVKNTAAHANGLSIYSPIRFE